MAFEVFLRPDTLHFVFVIVTAEKVVLIFFVDRDAGVVVHFGTSQVHDLLQDNWFHTLQGLRTFLNLDFDFVYFPLFFFDGLGQFPNVSLCNLYGHLN